jgi:hypothetical protein
MGSKPIMGERFISARTKFLGGHTKMSANQTNKDKAGPKEM